MVTFGDEPRRLIPPRPGPTAFPQPPGSLARRYPAAAALPQSKVDGGLYVMDTGLGLAFGSIAGGMTLLHQHYGEQLVYVEDVHIEWTTHKTRPIAPLGDGHTAADKAEYDHRVRLQAAAAAVRTQVETLFGPPVVLAADALPHVDGLIDELCALPPAKTRARGDRGECASIHHAMSRRYGEGFHLNPANSVLSADPQFPVTILCANDDRARKLSHNKGVAVRNMHTVLREMVHAGAMTAEDAWGHYQMMETVTQLATLQRPRGADDFR